VLARSRHHHVNPANPVKMACLGPIVGFTGFT
jgi:hypothetical protein